MSENLNGLSIIELEIWAKKKPNQGCLSVQILISVLVAISRKSNYSIAIHLGITKNVLVDSSIGIEE